MGGLYSAGAIGRRLPTAHRFRKRATRSCSNPSAPSHKWLKRQAQRKLRKARKRALRDGAEVYPLLREVSNVWCFPKDGKFRFDPAACPRLVRK